MTEHELQKKVIAYIKAVYPETLYTATQGGVNKSVQAAAKMRAAGYVKGTPDILIFDRAGKYCGLAIELKKDKKSKPTIEQALFLNKLYKRGWFAICTYGFEDTKEFIDIYMNLI